MFVSRKKYKALQKELTNAHDSLHKEYEKSTGLLMRMHKLERQITRLSESTDERNAWMRENVKEAREALAHATDKLAPVHDVLGE